jgi:hypothetical protein
LPPIPPQSYGAATKARFTATHSTANPFDRQPMERCGTHKMIKFRTEIPSDSAQGSKS